MNDENSADNITSMKVRIYSAGGDAEFAPFNLKKIDAIPGAISIFNYKTNERYPGTIEWDGASSDSAMILIYKFTTPLDIPDNDITGNEGVDFGISIHSETTMIYGSDFYAEIRTLDFAGTRKVTERFQYSDTITARPYTVFKDYSYTPNVKIGPALTLINETPVFAIQVTDNGKGLNLKTLTFSFMNVGNDVNFDPSVDLRAITLDNTSGISIWRESGDVIGFNGTSGSDILLVPHDTPIISGSGNKYITFDFSGSYSDTGIANTYNESSYFYIVVRSSQNVSHGDDFKISIAVDNITYEDTLGVKTFKNGQSAVSNYPFYIDAQPPQFNSSSPKGTVLDKSTYKKGDNVVLTITFSNYASEDSMGIRSIDLSQFDNTFSFDSVIITNNYNGSFSARYRIRTSAEGNTVPSNAYKVYVSAIDKVGNVSYDTTWYERLQRGLTISGQLGNIPQRQIPIPTTKTAMK